MAELCEADIGRHPVDRTARGLDERGLRPTGPAGGANRDDDRTHVRQAELRRALRKHPENLDAYDFVLRGLDLLYRLRREEFEQARDMFQRAIELEPGMRRPTPSARTGTAFGSVRAGP